MASQVALIFLVPWADEGRYNVVGILLLVAVAVSILRLSATWIPAMFNARLERYAGIVAAGLLIITFTSFLPWQLWTFDALSPQEREQRVQATFGQTYIDAKRLITGCAEFREGFGDLQSLTLSPRGNNSVVTTPDGDLGMFTFDYLTTEGRGQIRATINQGRPSLFESISVLQSAKTKPVRLSCENRMPP